MNQINKNNQIKESKLNVPLWFEQNTKGQQLSIKEKNKFMSNAIALMNNKSLEKVTKTLKGKETILSAVLQATLLNLPLEQSFGYAWVVPYNNKNIVNENGINKEKWIHEAQFQVGYKGYIQLALRSQQYKDINISDVRKGELKKLIVLKE